MSRPLRIATIYFFLGIDSTLMLSGCTSQAGAPVKTAPPTPKPSPTATPLPVHLVGSGVDSTLFDEKGSHIAEVKASGISVGPSQAKPTDTVGVMASGTATLYQKNRPVATLAADHLHADRDTRIVIGTGNVVVHSLAPDGNTVRADKMTWFYDKNKIIGEGNVVVTRNPDFRAPGKRFEADTALQSFTLYGNDAPITGSF